MKGGMKGEKKGRRGERKGKGGRERPNHVVTITMRKSFSASFPSRDAPLRTTASSSRSVSTRISGRNLGRMLELNLTSFIAEVGFGPYPIKKEAVRNAEKCRNDRPARVFTSFPIINSFLLPFPSLVSPSLLDGVL